MLIKLSWLVFEIQNWLDLFSVCVCFFGSLCLKLLLRDVFKSLKGWLDHWLCCMLDCIHICIFPSWKIVFKKYWQLLDTSSTPGYLSSFSTSSYRNLDSFSTVRWINRDFFWILDSCSINRGWLLLDSFLTPLDPSRFFCMHCFSHVLHLSFLLLSITFCFITFMHLYGFFVPL